MGEMKRRMTITEALNELKLLESRIQKATYNVIFVGCAKKSSDKIGHKNKETFEKEAKAVSYTHLFKLFIATSGFK